MGYGEEFEARLKANRLKAGIYHKSDIVSQRYRSYSGAKIDRLTDDWNITESSADTEIKSALPRIRSRSRDLEQNNDYVEKYLNMNEGNVMGAAGIRLQSKARTFSGEIDKDASQRIQEAWAKWGKLGTCTVDGQFSWNSLEKLIARSVPRDGEILLRIVRNFDNGFRFSLQVLEPDFLNINLDNIVLHSGNTIRMGVEFNKWKRPVAYWILSVHPGDTAYSASAVLRNSTRVPAEEILHIYSHSRAGQTRGIPWLHTAMVRLKMLGAYEEAELVASRMAASKVWVYERTGEGKYEGDGEDALGGIEDHIEPGMSTQPPVGVEMKVLDPTHPNSAYDAFIKAALRGVASGLNVSYVSLANDLKGVNFSSIRQGVLDERTGWRITQQFYIEYMHQRVFDAWLPFALMTELKDLNFSDIGLLSHARWQPRGWGWVDPLKDSKANIQDITANLKSPSEVIRASGRDPDEVWAEIAEDKKKMQELGIFVQAPQIIDEPEDTQPEDDNEPEGDDEED